MSDDMREAFEKWCRPTGSRLTPSLHTEITGDTYAEEHVEFAYYAWQAALQSLPRVTEAELAKAMFETNPTRNPALEWHHAATPKNRYMKHAKALAAKFPHIIKESV